MCDDDGSEGHCDRAALGWLIYLTTRRAAAWLHLQRAWTHGSDEPSHRSTAWADFQLLNAPQTARVCLSVPRFA